MDALPFIQQYFHYYIQMREDVNLRFAGGSPRNCSSCRHHTGQQRNPVHCNNKELRKIYDEYCNGLIPPKQKEEEWKNFNLFAGYWKCNYYDAIQK